MLLRLSVSCILGEEHATETFCLMYFREEHATETLSHVF